jgi:hypothetical protein
MAALRVCYFRKRRDGIEDSNPISSTDPVTATPRPDFEFKRLSVGE